jgi:hypothetical protein
MALTLLAYGEALNRVGVGMLPCTPRAPFNLRMRAGASLEPLFLELFSAIVSIGLAGAHVQPCPRILFHLRKFGRRQSTGPVAQMARAHP